VKYVKNYLCLYSLGKIRVIDKLLLLIPDNDAYMTFVEVKYV